ncbi:MAG: hypothetical protein ACOX7E_06350 [Paludibacter sp.]|jgi:hypothetical protein|nr:hypothetical protein [Paludibacter sp.]HOS46793.1 hypothetical protein [Paludibacter sp.]HPM10935.1 hypothetical protein [Paludibacter sp.]
MRREFLYILFFVALIGVGIYLVKTTYSDDMLSQDYLVYVSPIKNPYNQDFKSSKIASSKKSVTSQSLVDNPFSSYTNQNNQLPNYKATTPSASTSQLPSTHNASRKSPIATSIGGGATAPIPYGFGGSSSRKNSESGTSSNAFIAQGPLLSSSGSLSGRSSVPTSGSQGTILTSPPSDPIIDDYVPGDITHPGIDPTEDPIGIPVGEGLLPLLLMGIVFALLKSRKSAF